MIRISFVLAAFATVITGISCKKDSAPPGPDLRSGNKEIISFILKKADNPLLERDAGALITNDSIIIVLPYGTIVTALKPTIVHNGISVNPATGVSKDFSGTVNYTVTAENTTQQTYKAVIKYYYKSTVFAGAENGNLFALDGETGEVKWTYIAGGSFYNSTPAYYNNTVFIGNSDGFLYAVDAVTGNLKWRYFSNGSASNSTCSISDGKLYFNGSGMFGGFIYSLDPATGNLLWQSGSNLRPYPPCISGNAIFYATGESIRRINIFTGAAETSGIVTGICYNNPAFSDGILYTGGESFILQAFNVNTNAVMWTFRDLSVTSSYGGPGSPAIHNGKVFGASFTNNIYAVDSAAGSLAWVYKPVPSISGNVNGRFSPFSAGNNMLYTTNAYSALALNENTGEKIWSFDLSGSQQGYVTTNCTLKDYILYTGSCNKNVYALNAITGEVIWQFYADSYVNGGLCVVTDNGEVFNPGISGTKQ